MIVTDERVARFVSARLGFALCPPYTCVGTERHGEIINGVILTGFEPHDVQVTVAGKGWTRGFLEAFGAYVYDQLGVARITFLTEQTGVVRLARKLGGEVEGRMRDHFGEGRDAIIIGVLKRDWKFARVCPS